MNEALLCFVLTATVYIRNHNQDVMQMLYDN